MGLREKKKARTRRAILSSLRGLLAGKDYSEITMEEIAAASDIAVGTLYNYFRSKSELLFSLIVESDDRYLAQAETLISGRFAPPAARLTDLMVLATEFCMKQLGKAAWRHMSASALVNTDEDMGLTYATTTRKHQALVARLMHNLQADGSIRQDIDADMAAHLVFSMKSKLFLDFITDEAATLEDHRAQVRQGVDLVLQGLCTDVAAPVAYRMKQMP